VISRAGLGEPIPAKDAGERATSVAAADLVIEPRGRLLRSVRGPLPLRAPRRHVRSWRKEMSATSIQWDSQTEGVGGLLVDGEEEARRLLDRQLAGFCTVDDLVYIERRASVELSGALA